MSKAAIILAAGAGTRMKSALPKVLHKVAALPLLGHVVAALRAAGVERIVVVTSPAGDAVRDYALALGCEAAIQHQQLGTGHAAASAREALANFAGTLVVINGDMPLVTGDTISECLKVQARAGLALLAFERQDPGAYGRVLLTPDGYLNRIVEFKDATVSERAATLCNAGCYAADARQFFGWASRLNNYNAQKEYYLTDVPSLAREEGVKCAVALADEISVTGVNSRAELAYAERKYQDRVRARMLADGVTMIAPETVFFAHDTVVENDVEIEPFVVFGPGVAVKSGARLRSHSHLEGATVASGAIIGPFARLQARGAHRRGRPYRQFRGSEEYGDRRRAPRPIILPILAMREWARAPISVLAPSPATMTASPKQSPISVRAPSSAPTPRWWRRSRSARALLPPRVR